MTSSSCATSRRGSLWAGLSSEAIEGELMGTQLEQIPFTQVFWFAWTDFFSDAPLYGVPA